MTEKDTRYETKTEPFEFFVNAFGRGKPLLQVKYEGRYSSVIWADGNLFDYQLIGDYVDTELLGRVLMECWIAVPNRPKKAMMTWSGSTGVITGLPKESAMLFFEIVKVFLSNGLKKMLKLDLNKLKTGGK